MKQYNYFPTTRDQVKLIYFSLTLTSLSFLITRSSSDCPFFASICSIYISLSFQVSTMFLISLPLFITSFQKLWNYPTTVKMLSIKLQLSILLFTALAKSAPTSAAMSANELFGNFLLLSFSHCLKSHSLFTGRATYGEYACTCGSRKQQLTSLGATPQDIAIAMLEKWVFIRKIWTSILTSW